jgi:galactitol-specific phosphotransferase system IIB component
MKIYDIYKSVIETGDYVLSGMEERIETVYAQGKITAEERASLLTLASEKADQTKQIDIVAKLAELEARIAKIESAGVVVWKSGMSTAKGQTVLYDILKEGQLRYCRYDGGRSATSLSPGKIDGWVILETAGGAVTHTVSKDENGNIILIPVEGE